jgi:calcineurin-like phosphoesterase family protein
MATYFTADTHFGHANSIKHSHRPFEDVREMDEAMIANWNRIVGPKDEVWHLGDFADKCTEEHMQKVFRRLHGSKHLIVGNHDDGKTKRLPWASVSEQKSITVDGVHLHLCHYAMRTWPRAHKGSLMLYGHSHTTLPGWRQSLDVGVDGWAFRPVDLPAIRMTLSELPRELPAVGVDHLGSEDEDDAFTI